MIILKVSNILLNVKAYYYKIISSNVHKKYISTNKDASCKQPPAGIRPPKIFLPLKSLVMYTHTSTEKSKWEVHRLLQLYTFLLLSRRWELITSQCHLIEWLKWLKFHFGQLLIWIRNSSCLLSSVSVLMRIDWG